MVTSEGLRSVWKSAYDNMCPSAWWLRLRVISRRNQQRNRWRQNTPWCCAANPGEQLKRRPRLKTKPQMTKPRMTELWKSASLTAALPARHLKESAECREKACPNLFKCFTILAKARNSSHLGFLEAIFIARRSPVLCSQKEFVRGLALF